MISVVYQNGRAIDGTNLLRPVKRSLAQSISHRPITLSLYALLSLMCLSSQMSTTFKNLYMLANFTGNTDGDIFTLI